MPTVRRRTRIFHCLVEEHVADVSYRMVQRYGTDLKPQTACRSRIGVRQLNHDPSTLSELLRVGH
ncbi:hypothetical protein [Streptomyces ehimensis]|uniref:Transposase n=1 Tax=Streptomyces ehimensis TaxID=68195 RepID=A0ABV9BVK5_9ACTN